MLRKYFALTLFFLMMLIVGCEKKEKSPSPDIVATFVGGQITRKQVDEYLKQISKSLDASSAKVIRRKEVFEKIVKKLATDYMINEKMKGQKLDSKKNIKHVMKHIKEEISINEMHSQAHKGKIRVSEIEIRNYYEANRDQFGKRPLVEVKQNIRKLLVSKGEDKYFLEYVEGLKKDSVITREYRLLEIPRPTEEDFVLYDLKNRKTSGSLGQAPSEEKDKIIETLGRQKEKEWFDDNKNKTLFSIDGKRYSVGEFYQELQELAPDEQQKYRSFEALKTLMDRIITRLLIVNDTDSQMVDGENKEKIKYAKTDILRQILHQEEVDDKLDVSDEEVRKYYEDRKNSLVAPPEVMISYVRISSGESEDDRKRSQNKVEEAYNKLNPGFWKEGESFEKIAREYSEDIETAKKGGEKDGWISETGSIFEEYKSHFLHRVALNLGEGEISEPFEFRGSYYILKVRKRKEEHPLAFEDVSERIKHFLSTNKHEEYVRRMEIDLMEKTNLVIYDEVIESMLNND